MSNREGLRKGWLLWVALGLLVLGSLSSAQGAWARPGEGPACQTVPTATPVPPPDTPAPPAPTPPPGGPAPYVHLEADVQTIEPGDEFLYRAVAGNGGQATAEDARLTLFLPEGISVVEVLPARGEVTREEEYTAIALGGLAPGEEVEVRVHVQVGEATPLGTILEGHAELAWTGGTVTSDPVYVGLPPGSLPVTGGAVPTA